MEKKSNNIWREMGRFVTTYLTTVWHVIKDLLKDMGFFWFPWCIFIGLLVSSYFFSNCETLLLFFIVPFFIFLVIKPMHVIYGLIGTKGNISSFFIFFILINLVFSGVYHFAFFKDAGITYDVNQPHIEFNLFQPQSDSIGVFVNCQNEMLPNRYCEDTAHYYYRMDYSTTLRNTILTSLMQEPTDFFSITSNYTGLLKYKPKFEVHNQAEKVSAESNYRKTAVFHWFLIFHILISWILLGVFISLLYQKFRKS